MTETDHLRALLEQAAPAHPDLTPVERARTVVRRGRAARRRDPLLTGAAALVVAAAASAALALRGDDAPEATTPAPAPAAAVCPAPPPDIDAVPATTTLTDLTSVRACSAAGGPTLATALLTGADAEAFADQVRALPPYAPPDLCASASVAFEPWVLAIGLGDGSSAMVGGGSRLCSSVEVDGVERDAGAVLQIFMDRAALETPRCDDAPADAGPGALGARPRSGRVCAGGGDVALSTEELAVLAEDFRGRRRAAAGRACGDPAPTRRVVLVDDRGVVTAWSDEGCAGVLRTQGAIWAVGDAALRVIDDALSRRPG